MIPSDEELQQSLERLDRAKKRNIAAASMEPRTPGQPIPVMTDEDVQESAAAEREFALALISYKVVLLRRREWSADRIEADLKEQLPGYEQEIRSALENFWEGKFQHHGKQDQAQPPGGGGPTQAQA